MNAATAIIPTMLNDHSQRQSHGHCGHPATKAGRAWCRRQQAKAAGVPNTTKSTSRDETLPTVSDVTKGVEQALARLQRHTLATARAQQVTLPAAVTKKH